MFLKPEPLVLDELKAKVRLLERGGVAGREGFQEDQVPVCRLGPAGPGASGLDAALPWGGLPYGALHEVSGRRHGGAAGFAAALAGRLLAGRPPGLKVLWCQTAADARETGELYGPGLAAFGLAAERLIMVRASRPAELLWAVEEGLNCPDIAVVAAELGAIDLRASRRLQLAAEATGTTGLLLRPGADEDANASLTRWRVSAVAGTAGQAWRGARRWQLDLWRCRGGRPWSGIVEWDEQAFRFGVVAVLADRPSLPVRQSA